MTTLELPLSAELPPSPSPPTPLGSETPSGSVGELRPGVAPVASDLGSIETRCRRILARRPRDPQPLAYLGYSLAHQGKFSEAGSCFERALSTLPNDAQILTLAGNALAVQGRHREALPYFEHALASDPTFPNARMGRAETRLALGDLAGGWSDFETRLEFAPPARPVRQIAQPWEGQYLGPDKTLLIWVDYSLGDTLQFCRLVNHAKERSGARILLECHKPLVRLLRDSGLADETIAMSEEPLAQPHHYQVSVTSLAFHLGITLDNLPGAPYLRPDPIEATRWRQRMTLPTDTLNVGVVWRGNWNRPGVYVRSTELCDWGPIFAVPGVSFYSLQKDGEGAPDFADFSDTAATITNLDLVISVDTSVAHLAGAMGKELWLLLPHNACWRWLMDTDRSPWYPQARLFRQTMPFDWKPVLHQVATVLADRVGAPHPTGKEDTHPRWMPWKAS